VEKQKPNHFIFLHDNRNNVDGSSLFNVIYLVVEQGALDPNTLFKTNTKPQSKDSTNFTIAKKSVHRTKLLYWENKESVIF